MCKYLLFIITTGFPFVFCNASDTVDSTEIATTIYKEYANKKEQISSIQSLRDNIDESRNQNLKFIFYYHLARFSYLKGNTEKVLQYSDSALSIPIEKILYKAKTYNLIGAAYSINAQYEKAVMYMVMAMEIYDDHEDIYNSAIIKNNIANIFISIRDYQSAYDYAFSAYNKLKSINDTTLLPQITGVLAITKTHNDTISRTDDLVKESIRLSERYNNILGKIIGYYAYGDYYNAIDEYHLAIEKFKFSLKMSRRLHLKQYETFNKIGLLNSYSHEKQFDSAIHYGEQALRESKVANNQNTLFSIYKNLGRSYAGKKEFSKAYDYTYKAEQLFEQLASQENIEAINKMLIKYETEKKEKEIISQQLEIVKKEKQVIQRSRLLYLMVGLIIIGILLFFWLWQIYLNRIHKLKLNRTKEIKEAIVEGENKERARLASELHDSIASSITGIKLQLEYAKKSDQPIEVNQSIEELSRLHNDVRRVSHNIYPFDIENDSIIDHIKEIINRQPEKPTKFEFVNLCNQKLHFPPEDKKIILQIIQELIHNVHKHAQAKDCKVQISKLNNEFVLTVEDNGKGIQHGDNKSGIGLQSIQKRVEILKGQITLEQSESKGTLVIIYIPIK